MDPHREQTIDGVRFVGIGLANKAKGVCALCAAMVPDDGRTRHAWWHVNVIGDAPQSTAAAPPSADND
jgi:hypothetical protein